MLAAVEPDVHLVGTLLSLNKVMPETTRETARAVVRKVVERARAAARRPDPGRRHRRARPGRAHPPAAAAATSTGTATIRANLKHYQPAQRTVVPERLVGYGRGRRRRASATWSCAIDQSGSMAESVVYAAVFGAVLASMPVAATPRWSSSTPRSST